MGAPSNYRGSTKQLQATSNYTKWILGQISYLIIQSGLFLISRTLVLLKTNHSLLHVVLQRNERERKEQRHKHSCV